MPGVRATLDAIVPDVAKGLRAAAATIGPFYLARALHRPELVWVALGGWLGSLVDPGGVQRSRAVGIFLYAAVGGVTVAFMQEATAWPWLAGCALAMFAFATSLLRAVGGWGSTFGTMLLIAAAVGVSVSRGASLPAGLSFFVGATWAMLLSSVVWPVWMHRPVRRAIGKLFGTLANYATAIAACSRETAGGARGGDALWGEMGRKHQRAIRAAIEEARRVAVALRTRRLGESRLGSNLRMLMGNGEVEFFALIAFAEEMETLRDSTARESAARTLEDVAAAYGEIRDRMLMRGIPPPRRVWWGGEEGGGGEGRRSGEDRRSGVPQTPLAQLAARLVVRSHRALTVARAPDEATVDGEDSASADAPRSHRSRWQEGLEEYRDALSLQSPFFRHAVRVMFTVGTAFFVGRIVSPTHTSWITITAVAVLQPYPGAAVRRAFERLVGTAFGSAAAVMLMIGIASPGALALAMVPLCTAAVVTQPRSYRLFTFFLTPVFVLVADRFQPTWWTAAARAGDAVIGGAIALVFALLVFPSREQKRLADALGTVVNALSRYAETIFDVHSQVRPPASPKASLEKGAEEAAASARTNAARRAVGIALGDAETSLERMLAEPRSFQR
ncbi:MAG TPA: FUSC family protein, partial [Polyangiaceae bacterium]|nr:FUSC family protein [Polyangiaceae bacterium]